MTISNCELEKWNNDMYKLHPTPYGGIAGWIQRGRIAAIKKWVVDADEKSILEIGCESGHLICSFGPTKRLVGIDISSSALQDAAQIAEKMGIKVDFLKCDAMLPLPIKNGEFDVIISSEMLEHVPDPKLVIKNIAQIATDKSQIIVTVPIEKPKLIIKNILKKTGLMGIILRGIEDGQSAWHLHAYDHKLFLDTISGYFSIKRSKNIWGLHMMYELKKI